MPSSSCSAEPARELHARLRAADDDGAPRLRGVLQQRTRHACSISDSMTSSTGVTSTQVTTTRRENSSENLVM